MPGGFKWRRWLVGGLTFAIMIAVLVTAFLRRNERNQDAAAIPALSPTPVTIVPGIHLLGGLNPAAVYVVETSNGLVLIDAGLEHDASLVKSQMAELGLDWKRIRAILLTHVHGDHSGGAEFLRQATGATVYAGSADAQVLRDGGPHEAFFSTFNIPNAKASPTTVDMELKDAETPITIGDARFRALATPGHTPGCICYLLEHKNRRILFSGDVIMSLVGNEKSAARMARPLGTYSTYLPPRYRGNAKDFLASLERLRALPVPDLVLPGHPRMDAQPQSPALSEARWHTLLDDGIGAMAKLLARYERDGRNFLDGTPRRLTPDLYYLGDIGGTAVPGFFASSELFLVNAPGGPGLLDFVNDRLAKLGGKATKPTAVLLTSSGPEDTAGLRDLVEASGASVVAAAEAIQEIKKICPPQTTVISSEDLPAKGWFDVKVLPLSGRGETPVAYVITLGKKKVLFSGRIPVPINQASAAELYGDFLKSRGNRIDYRASLDLLEKLQPDLWLPAAPADGQNANLYDAEWQEIIANNRELLRNLK